MDMGKNSWEDGASEHIPTHLKQLQTKADAYQKAGDIKSANALRDKIKIIKTKHGMAPASTQKAEERKPFDRLNTQYVKPAFNLGDKVRSIHNPNMIGEVSHVGPYDDFLGTHRYKVSEPNGRRHFWTGTGMTKISDEEHAKGTPYYKPTQKSEVLSKNYKEEDIVHENHPFAVLKHDKGHYKVIHNLGTHSMVVGNYHLPDKPEYALQRAKDNADERASLVKEGKYPHMNPSYYNKPHEKSETETRLAILAKGLKAAITLRGLVKAEKETSKDRYIVRFNDGKSASKKEFTKKGAAHSHAQKKIDEGYGNVPLHHYGVDNPIKENKLEINSIKKSEQLNKASGLSPENQLKFTQNRAFSSTDNANQSNDKTAHSYAKDFHNKSAEVANKVGKPHVAEYHRAIAKHHEEVVNNPNDYQITKPSGHTGLSPENKIKYSQNRADSSTEIAHGSNDATHHSNAAHFHRKASEVASSVGHKVLANYHNNIAKYHENESSGGGNK